nr:hypothetical protein [Bacteroidota bacterium]
KKNIFFLFIPVLILNSGVYCQKLHKVTGTAQVRFESNMTKEQAREKAKELAMINAIESVFGTYVEQETDILVEDGKMNYNIIGTTRVKGEWVKTAKIDFTEEKRVTKGIYGTEYEIWITCTIKGTVKKAMPKANIIYQTLNCPEFTCRTTDFFSGESLYLHFKSPVNGYLSVFLRDGNTVYRLLPYDDMTEKYHKAVPVKGDEEYILFSKKDKYFDNENVNELELFTYLKHAYNSIYIIFAEEPYTKPLLDQDQVSEYKERYRSPKSLSLEDFNIWLSGNRALMDSFQDRRVKIKIVKD